MKLIDNWRAEVFRLWSMRVVVFWTMFWSALAGIYSVWPAFQDRVSLGWFVGLGVLMPVSLAIARLLKQPGADV